MQLTAAFVAAGLTVYRDVDGKAGELWAERFTEEIAAAKCTVVLWTPRSLASPWVLNEAELALRCKNLLSVVCDEVRIDRWDPTGNLAWYYFLSEAFTKDAAWNTQSPDGLRGVVEAVRKYVSDKGKANR
jgi:hypothetical protein